MAGPYAAQAQSEIKAAYKPVMGGLNRQERRIQNIDRKQGRDEQAYQGWLKDTQNHLNAAAAARDQELAGISQAYHGDLVNAIGNSQADAATRAAHVGGEPAPPIAGIPDVAARGTAAIGTDASHLEAQTTRQRLGVGLVTSVDKNNFAYLAASRAQRRAKVLDALAQVGDARNKATLQQAADIARRESDLATAAAKAQQQAQARADKLAYQTATLAQGDARIAQGDQRIAQGNTRIAATAIQNHRTNVLARQRLAKTGQRSDPNFITPGQHARANADVQHLLDVAMGNIQATTGTGANAKTVKPPSKYTRATLSAWFQNTFGVSKNLADVAAEKRFNPNKALAPDRLKQFQDHARTLKK